MMKKLFSALTFLLLASSVSATNMSSLQLTQSFTFAGLGTPANGALYYCSDCTNTNPCAGSGSGAMASREGGAWNCGVTTTGGSPVGSSRTLTAGAGLTGGGTLAADRTFNVGQNADASIIVNADDIQRAALSGPITVALGSNTTVIGASAADGSTLEVSGGALREKDAGTTNAKLANMAANTVKANITGGSAAPTDVALASFKTWLAIVSTDISDFAAAVRATVLTGLSTATSTVVTAADSVLVAFGKLQAQINILFSTHCYATQQAGATADVQINACNTILTAAGGGVLDATGYGPTVQSILAVVSVGDSSGDEVTLYLDRSTTFNVTVTGGSSVDVFKHFSRSSINWLGMGNPSTANFVVQPTTNVNSIFASYPRTTQWVGELENVVVEGNASATVLSVFDYSGMVANSRFTDVAAYLFNGNGAKFTANSGSTIDKFICDNCSFNGAGGTAGCPLLIDGTASSNLIVGMEFRGGVMAHPGASCASHAAADMEGGASNTIRDVNFFDTRVESSNTTDIGFLENNTIGVHVHAATASGNVNNGTSLVKMTATAGVSYDNDVYGLELFNPWTNAIQDVVNGITITGAAQSHMSQYIQMQQEGAVQYTKAIIQPRPSSDNSITAATAGINSTETIVVKSQTSMLASRLSVGSHIHIVLGGTVVTSAANVSTFAVRIGTAGTTGDGLMASCATTAAGTTNTGTSFQATIDLTIATSTTALGQCVVTENATATGLMSAQLIEVLTPTFTAFNTATAAQFIDVTYKAAAATTTATFTLAQLEVFYK